MIVAFEFLRTRCIMLSIAGKQWNEPLLSSSEVRCNPQWRCGVKLSCMAERCFGPIATGQIRVCCEEGCEFGHRCMLYAMWDLVASRFLWMRGW